MSVGEIAIFALIVVVGCVLLSAFHSAVTLIRDDLRLLRDLRKRLEED